MNKLKFVLPVILSFTLAIPLYPSKAYAVVTPVVPSIKMPDLSPALMLTTKANLYKENNLIAIQQTELKDNAIGSWAIDGITVHQYIEQKINDLKRRNLIPPRILAFTVTVGVYSLFTEMAEYCVLSANGFDLAAQKKLESYIENVLLNMSFHYVSEAALPTIISETVEFGEQFYPRTTASEWQSFRMFRAKTEALLTDPHLLKRIVAIVKSQVRSENRKGYVTTVMVGVVSVLVLGGIGSFAHVPPHYLVPVTETAGFGLPIWIRMYGNTMWGIRNVKKLSHTFVKRCRDILVPETSPP